MYSAMERRRILQNEAAGLFAREMVQSLEHEVKISEAPVSDRVQITSNQIPSLLRMPAEIRNQIFSLVLGNNSLHIYAHKTNKGETRAKVEYYSCIVPHRHQILKAGPQHPEWLKQHMSCFTRRSAHPPNIGLMFTCRQIYAETKLLPYSTNEFIFVAPTSLQTYVERCLSLEQSKALRTLSIWSPLVPGASAVVTSNPSDMTGTWNSWIPSVEIVDRKLLGGVQELRLNISVFARRAGRDEWEDLEEVQGLFQFMKLARLKRVSIAVGNGEENRIVDDDERAAIQAYADNVRAKLLDIHVPGEVIAEQQRARNKEG